MEEFIKVMNGLVMTLEEDEIFYVFGCSIQCEQFYRFANGGAKILIKSYFMRSFFFSVYSAVAVKR